MAPNVEQDARMAASHTSRVSYFVSADLVTASDALACHPGRSSLVHSLIYHTGLLSLPQAEQAEEVENGEELGGIQAAELKLLRQLLDPDTDYDGKMNVNRRKAQVIITSRAEADQLEAFHDFDYVSAILDGVELAEQPIIDLHVRQGRPAKRAKTETGANDVKFGLVDDCARFPLLPQHAKSLAAASTLAAESLASSECDVGIVWDGGRHHAHRDRAAGFCFVNDAVLAILALRKPRHVLMEPSEPGTRRKKVLKRLDRVLYLDLDLHWGDGVEEAFYNSASVLTLSVHHHAPGFFPVSNHDDSRRTDGSLGRSGGPESAPAHALSLPLPLGASDETFRTLFASCIEPVIDEFDPEAFVVQCGTDGAAGDPHRVWNLSSEAYIEAVGAVLRRKKPTLLLGGGGYHAANTARIWSSLTALALTDSAALDPQVMPEIKRNIATAPIPDFALWSSFSCNETCHVPAGETDDGTDERDLLAAQDKFKQHVQTLNKLKAKQTELRSK